MTESVVRFQGPPPEPRQTRFGKTRKHYEKVTAELRAHPGEWGIVGEFDVRMKAASLAHRISNGTVVAFRPAGSYKAVARQVGEQHLTYARYIGEDGGMA